MNRIDKPIIDTDESYVWWNSPAVTTNMLSQTYHTEVNYGWSSTEPLVLEMAISINLDSVPLDDVLYPEGHVCHKCLLPMPYGTVAISVPINDDDVELWCIACTRDQDWTRWYTQTWELSLVQVRQALLGLDVGEGMVVITNPTPDSLTFKLTGDGPDGEPGQYAFVNVPLSRLETFVKAIDEYMGAGDMLAVETAFLDSELDLLERLANGESNE